MESATETKSHMPIHHEPPVGWGEDRLSHFQGLAILNEYATFAHHSDWQSLLLDLATVLDKCSQHAMDNILKVRDPSALLLFVTAHNQFLATVRLSASGHCLATYPVSRASVESAVYGWYLSCNEEAGNRWHNKPPADDKDGLRKWNSEFKFSSVCRKLAIVAPNEEVWAKHLHQSAIDMGSHPNKDALYANMRAVASEHGTPNIQMQFLHQWGVGAAATMKVSSETGMFIHRLFTIAFPEAAKGLGVSDSAHVFVRRLRILQEAANREFATQK